MLVGHFAAAFVGKHIEPRLSLGTLVLAAMLPDILWPIFSIAGIEYVAAKPEGAESGFFEVPFSHSLLMVKRMGVYAFWPVVIFITFVWVTNVKSGPPPPKAVIGSLIFFLLLVAWAYWINRLRPARS